MSRIAAIAVAALALGAIVFSMAQPQPSETAGLAEVATTVDVVDATQKMRVCVGPARVTLGGEPFVGLAFGGDGCDHNAANLVGFRILRGPTVPQGPALSFRAPRL